MTAVAFNGTAHLFVTSVILGIIILSTVVGNVFVLLAIILERNLHNVANYLIASLAVADLMVATLVMPLAAVKEMSTRWFLGQEACDAFTSFDVLCCTASILHLVSISLDRYWAVSRVDYIRNRSARRILVMIAASWGISAVISIPPLFGWRHQTASDPVTVTPVDGSSDGGWSGNDTGVNVTDGTIVSRTFVKTDNVNDVDDCLISQDWGYTVFSTLGAFYIPLFFMLIVYARIYQLARARIRKKLFAKREAAASSSTQGDNSRKKNARTHDTNGRTTVKADLTIATLTDNATTFATAVEDDDPFDGQATNLMPTTTTTTLTVLLQTPPDSPSNDRPLPKPDMTSSVVVGDCAVPTTPPTCCATTTSGSRNESPDRLKVLTIAEAGGSCQGGGGGPVDLCDVSPTVRKADVKSSSGTPIKSPEPTAREKRERSRERKAARTLAIITGSFIGCWLPFFIVALVRPFCGERCHFPDLLVSIITWLGYFSSLLNPIIYNVFNPDFRSASRKILFGKYRNRL